MRKLYWSFTREARVDRRATRSWSPALSGIRASVRCSWKARRSRVSPVASGRLYAQNSSQRRGCSATTSATRASSAPRSSPETQMASPPGSPLRAHSRTAATVDLAIAEGSTLPPPPGHQTGDACMVAGHSSGTCSRLRHGHRPCDPEVPPVPPRRLRWPAALPPGGRRARRREGGAVAAQRGRASALTEALDGGAHRRWWRCSTATAPRSRPTSRRAHLIPPRRPYRDDPPNRARLKKGLTFQPLSYRADL
jgi:hypothetical protein